MKKELLAGIAMLLLATEAAHAAQRPYVAVGRPKIIRTTIPGSLYPPPKYDKPYEGELEIVYFSNAEDLEQACKGINTKTACAYMSVDYTKCRIFMGTDWSMS